MSSYVPMEFVLGSVCFIVMQLAECFDISRSGQGLFFPRFLCLQVFNFSDTVGVCDTRCSISGYCFFLGFPLRSAQRSNTLYLVHLPKLRIVP